MNLKIFRQDDKKLVLEQDIELQDITVDINTKEERAIRGGKNFPTMINFPVDKECILIIRNTIINTIQKGDEYYILHHRRIKEAKINECGIERLKSCESTLRNTKSKRIRKKQLKVIDQIKNKELQTYRTINNILMISKFDNCILKDNGTFEVKPNKDDIFYTMKFYD